MATRWVDGFEDTAAADFAVDYIVAGSVSLVEGRRAGTFAVSLGSASAISKQIGGSSSTIFLSDAIRLTALPTSFTASRPLFKFSEGATTHCSAYITTSGAISVYRGEGVTLLGTSVSTVTPLSWTWLQTKVVVHDTAGSIEIRDSSGIVLLSLSNIDTRNGGTAGVCDTITLGTANTTTQHDDLHVWDATGTICNTFTNDTRIDHRPVTGPGTFAQFTPSAGSNFSCVDDPNFNTADYVESQTAGHRDTYTFGDITHSPPQIFGLVITAVAQKDDAGARGLKLLSRSGSSEAVAGTVTLNQGSYVRFATAQETDPATGVAWTPSGINASEIGFENV